MINTFSKQQVAQSFTRFASVYDEHAFVQKEIGQRLIERAQMLNQPITSILDLGAGPGIMFDPLKQAFPKANIVAIDLSWGMIQRAQLKSRHSWFKRSYVLQADMERLPFQAQSFDLVFSNCALQWALDYVAIFQQVKHVLRQDGCFLFSTFGPDTLIELKHLWAQVDDQPHVHDFIDMHDLGDMMQKVGFHQPVVDQERIQVTYSKLDRLLKDLKYTGARNLNPNRRQGLTSRQQYSRLQRCFDHNLKDNVFSNTYEVVYGHAMNPDAVSPLKKSIPLNVKY